MDLTFCLNQSWAGVYLQIFASIFIFGLGIPSIILQVVVDDDLRRVIQKHKIGHALSTKFMWGALGLIFLIIWYFHPCDSKSFYLNIKFLAWLNPLLELFKFNSGFIASALLSLSFIMLFYFWEFQENYRRKNVVEKLVTDAKKVIGISSTPPKEILESLQDLGQNGKSPMDRAIIIDALDELGKAVIEGQNYQCNQLDEITKTLEFCTNFSDHSSRTQVMNICEILINKIIRVGKIQNNPDARHILRLLQKITSASFDGSLEFHKSVKVISSITEFDPSVVNEMADQLLIMGVDAIKNGKHTSALDALNEMGFYYQNFGKQESILYRFLGLVSYFWAEEGSAKKYIIGRIRVLGSQQEITKLLVSASDYYLNNAKFGIADKLLQFSIDLQQNSALY